MSAWDNLLVAGILLFIFLLIWSRVMGQTMLDSLNELKEFIGGIFRVDE